MRQCVDRFDGIIGLGGRAMRRFPKLSDDDVAVAGRVQRSERSLEVLEVMDGEAFAVSGAVGAIRLRLDIGRDKPGKPMFFVLSPPLARHISRCLRRAGKDYMNNVTGDSFGSRGRRR